MIRQTRKKRLGILTASLLMGSFWTAAADAAELKSDLSVEGRMVTIGDLFHDAGDKADIIVFEAPAPGKSKSVSVRELERIAEKHELGWERPEYLKRVNLFRLSDTIPHEELYEFVHETAIEAGANPDSQLRFFGRKNGLLVPLGATAADLEFAQFDLNDRRDRFTATLLVPSGNDTPKRIAISGQVEEVRDIPVFNRNILPGETITEADISWIRYPARRVSTRAILSHQQLIGMTVRRALRPDTPVNTNDVMPPVVVAKGNSVTMVVRTSNMLLTAAGQALENGGIGDTIRVLNEKSRLTVDAKILAAGQVEILSGPNLALGSR